MPPGGGNNHEYYNPGYIGQQGGDPQAPSSSPYHGAADVEKHGAAEQAAVKAPLIVLGGSPDRAPKKKFTILGSEFTASK